MVLNFKANIKYFSVFTITFSSLVNKIKQINILNRKTQKLIIFNMYAKTSNESYNKTNGVLIFFKIL